MKKKASLFLAISLIATVVSNSSCAMAQKDIVGVASDNAKTLAAAAIAAGLAAKPIETDTLPPPYTTKSVMNFSNVIGWADGRTPKAPEGFTVTKYADKFENPRAQKKVYGRPVGVTLMPDGALLVTDDVNNIIWRVGAASK